MHSTNKVFRSWSHNPNVKPKQVLSLSRYDDLPDLAALADTMLPYAYGHTYGDSCLNEDGILLDMRGMNRLIAFNEQEGTLKCEAGIQLASILEVIVPCGWFLAVTPSTQLISVGGAIANDVHGENHLRAGTFGCHLIQLELLRSDGQRLLCSPTENGELFRATIGGLGLTGIILWAEIRLKRIQGPYILRDRIRYSSLADFMRIAEDSSQDYEYTFAWLDSLASSRQLGRGVFMRGNHQSKEQNVRKRLPGKLHLTVPFDFPAAAMSVVTIKALNEGLYRFQPTVYHRTVPYESFLYPLDPFREWHRIYGKRGILQHHCVIPFTNGYEIMKELLERISRARAGSFLTVLKTFGNISSPGMLSFPRPGLTLALDFPNRGKKMLKLFHELDTLVRRNGGALYPAKDAHMSADDFQCYYPQWKDFSSSIDPKFSSSFWRRVTKTQS